MTDSTRPAPDTEAELWWLRGFEAGVIQVRNDRTKAALEEAAALARSRGTRAVEAFAGGGSVDTELAALATELERMAREAK